MPMNATHPENPEHTAPDRPAEAPVFTSFVAVGDSFTEGMSDLLPDGSYRGWADLLATRLAARTPGFRYANLAVRGKLIGQIADEQAAPAAALGADLVTLVGGLNDVLRPKCDVGLVCDRLAETAERLAPSCRQLVLMRSPGRRGPVLERFRPRMERLFGFIDELAERHGALVVDLFGAEVLGDSRLWAEDRLHLNAEGHRRVAEAVWQALGLPAESDWRRPLPPAVRPGWATRRSSDLRFAREHLGPWIGRRLTGRSSGDGRAGAHFSTALGEAYFVTPAADPPGCVTGWQRWAAAEAADGTPDSGHSS
ncbi:SGNH/GDSL hydrolase family protein [Streptomyces mobaraensis]|uniref:SGNH/GDSL hydrolase family protein n=1 Tax=Streptomyces mobaraensis TaxID=35621 RepID=UPI0033186FB3